MVMLSGACNGTREVVRSRAHSCHKCRSGFFKMPNQPWSMCEENTALMSVVNALGARKQPFRRNGCL